MSLLRAPRLTFALPLLPAGALVFDPANITIAKGESVTFVNNAGFPHNVVFDEDDVPVSPPPPFCRCLPTAVLGRVATVRSCCSVPSRLASPAGRQRASCKAAVRSAGSGAVHHSRMGWAAAAGRICWFGVGAWQQRHTRAAPWLAYALPHGWPTLCPAPPRAPRKLAAHPARQSAPLAAPSAAPPPLTASPLPPCSSSAGWCER